MRCKAFTVRLVPCLGETRPGELKGVTPWSRSLKVCVREFLPAIQATDIIHDTSIGYVRKIKENCH